MNIRDDLDVLFRRRLQIGRRLVTGYIVIGLSFGVFGMCQALRALDHPEMLLVWGNDGILCCMQAGVLIALAYNEHTVCMVLEQALLQKENEDLGQAASRIRDVSR